MAKVHPAATTSHRAFTGSPRDQASVATDAAPRPDTALQPRTRKKFFGTVAAGTVRVDMGNRGFGGGKVTASGREGKCGARHPGQKKARAFRPGLVKQFR